MARTPHHIRKRPTWVWVASVYVLLTAGYALLHTVLTRSGVIAVPPAQAAYTKSHFPLMVLTASLNLAGAVALWRLRKVAVWLLTTALAVSLSMTIAYMLTEALPAVPLGAMVGGVVLAFGPLVAICGYVWTLWVRGVLR